MVAAAISSWYLTRMVSADKSDTIQFLYKADSLVQNDFSLSFTQNLGPQYIPNVPTDPGSVTLWPLAESTNERSYFPIRISSILFKGGRVDFVQKTGRLDKANVSLDSIVISSFNPSTQSYQRLKSVKLATNYLYSTLSNPTTPAYLGSDEPSKYRLILTDVLQNDQNNAPTAVYHLDYNPTMLPPLHNFGQDQWGFYNGQYANPSLLQSQQVAAGGVVFTIGGPYGADRSVNPTAMQAGMLQKITYPTKGFTEFNYESNFQNVPSSVQTSLDAASVGFYQDTSITYYTPTVSNLETGGSIFHVLIPHYGGIPDTLTIPFNPFVQITDLTTGNIFYSKQGNATTDVDETHTLDLVVGHHYQLMAVSVIHGATLQTNTNYLPKASILTSFVVQVGSATPVGGLRIASIRQYDSDSSLLGTETYEYPGEGTLLSASFMTNKITHTAWYLNSNTSAPLTTYCNASVYSLSSLSGSPVGYPNVTVYHGDATQNTGKSTFAYNIFADSVVFCPPAYFNGVMPVPITWKNGNPVHEAQYKRIGNGVYALEQEKYTSYNYFFKPNGRGLKIGATIEALGFDPFSFPYWTALDLYWFDYPISSGIRVPAQTIVNQYDSGGVTVVMTDTTNFYYDDTTLYMPTRKVTRDSRGRTMLTVTYRPLEKSAINALTALASDAGQAIDSMVARHILSPIIEEGHFIDGNLTQLSLSNYKLWNPQLIAPQNIQVQLGGGPLDTRILFNQYDASGNLLEVQKANDLKETYLWGYQGLYPVAKIQNTTYATASPYIAQSAMDHPTSDAALQTQLNSLRTIPGTLVNTFTYRPLVGMTSQIDPSGKTTYYEYDSFQRLKDTRDNQGNIIKTWDYHYKGQ
jgi:YD repeat-containing protein